MIISHTSDEFAATSRAFAILVGALHAKGIIDGRAIAGCIRIGAVETGGVVADLMGIMATGVTNTVERWEKDGPVKLAVVDGERD
ncbi:hypothetical protein [Sphingopyxis sp. RIFCSPHIGHO2_12_FULL_65_19]|uniref:hypothetical protein n=1 Tax=Sphingopyxis sp. RIFCSPHIGHO2_12_FULL_65_19 TaxID=1802172 RepID=UPI0008BA23D7|nr:hypothetical protein [Sphingopyxis sp. RIFCSPHIGHO2_12_FULL_65_19]OHD07567.1 MAG: hypothetical protein A3E77_09295 [Sphingopyxis sp. RIFCSPHIGHO2_12_FULL_65_19]